MTFLNPILAFTGLACIAVPILIHILMRRRRKPVEWGAMKFLLLAYQRQRRRMNLEQLLLLGARCLLVAVLAIALGRPVLGALAAVVSGGPRTLFILIDNSLTASASEPGGESGLARSRTAALALLDQLDPARGDRAALVTLGGPSDAVVLPPSGEFSVLRDQIAELAPTDGRGDLSGALTRLADDISRAQGEVRIAVLSEFRAGAFDATSSPPALARRAEPVSVVVQVPADAALDNTAIIGLEPLRRVLLTGTGDETARVASTFRVSLRRHGPGLASTATTKVRVTVGPPGAANDDSGEGVLRWAAGQAEGAALVNVDIPSKAAAGVRLVAIATIDRDSVAGDNTFRTPLEVRGRLEVALLASGPIGGRGTIDSYTPADWLAIALSPEADLAARRKQGGELRLSVIDPARPSAPASTGLILADADAIVIPNPDLLDAAAWDAVRLANAGGALVLIFPPPAAQTHLWTDAFVSAMGLDWSIERTPRDFTPAQSVSPRRTAEPDLLSFVAPELPDLVKPVKVLRTLPISAAPGGFGTLLALDDGTPLAVVSPPTPTPRGLIVFVTAAMHLSWTDLPTKPLMVPLVQEVVRQGVGQGSSLRVGVAGLPVWAPPTSVELIATATGETQGPSAFTVGAGGVVSPPVRHAGLFTARAENSRALALIAVNADTAASSTDTRTRDDVARWLGALGPTPAFLDRSAPNGAAASGSSEQSSSDAAFPLLLAALALCIVEAVFGRVFSHASTRDVHRAGGAKA